MEKMMLILKNCWSVGRYALVVVFVMVSGSSTALASTFVSDAVVADGAIPLPTKQGYRELALFAGRYNSVTAETFWEVMWNDKTLTRRHFIKFLVALNLEKIGSLTPEDVISRCKHYKTIHEGYLKDPETMPSYLSARFVRSINKILSLLLSLSQEQWGKMLRWCTKDLSFEDLGSLRPEDIISLCENYKTIHEGYLEDPETRPSHLSVPFVRSIRAYPKINLI
jgi:hypothetical protein